MSMAIAKTNKSSITHIVCDENKSRETKFKLHEGQAKMQQLVKTGTVNAVIASDAVRVSGNGTMMAMHREVFRVTDTRLWVGNVGVDPEEHLRLEHDRKCKAGEFLEQCHMERKDLIESLDKRTRQEHDWMQQIGNRKMIKSEPTR
jgi:hypothetical protein